MNTLSENERFVLFEALSTIDLPQAFKTEQRSARLGMIEGRDFSASQIEAARMAVERLQQDTPVLDVAIICGKLLSKLPTS